MTKEYRRITVLICNTAVLREYALRRGETVQIVLSARHEGMTLSACAVKEGLLLSCTGCGFTSLADGTAQLFTGDPGAGTEGRIAKRFSHVEFSGKFHAAADAEPQGSQDDTHRKLITSDTRLSLVRESRNRREESQSDSLMWNFQENSTRPLARDRGDTDERFAVFVFFDEVGSQGDHLMRDRGENRAVCYRTDFSQAGELLIGRSLTADIAFPDCALLSLQHAVIAKTETGKEQIRILSENGGYINQEYKEKESLTELFFGDEISLFAIKLLWFSDWFLLLPYGSRTAENLILVRQPALHKVESQGDCHMWNFQENSTRPLTRNSKEDIRGKESLPRLWEPHPIPRTVKSMNMTPVVLEAPPHKQTAHAESIWLTIGPAFTMTIPMVLGSGLAIYGNKVAGTETGGAFLYTGLITAGSAAFFGALWAVLNFRKRRMDEKKQERRRKRAYARYIAETGETIRKIYEQNRESYLYMYPPAMALCDPQSHVYLHNRRPQDSDFLSLRLGTGNGGVRAVTLELPKERFSLEQDSLSGLPFQLKERYESLQDAPVLIDLRESRFCGVITDAPGQLTELFFLLLIQLAYFIGRDKLGLAVFLTGEILPGSRLRMIRYLPQMEGCYFGGEEKALTDGSAIREAFAKKLSENRENKTEKAYVVLTDDYAAVRTLLAEHEKLHVLLFAESFTALPEDCSVIIEQSDAYSGILYTRDQSRNRPAIFDRVSLSKAQMLVRRLCSLSGAGEPDRQPVPQVVTMGALWDTEDFKELIRSGWQQNDTVSDMRVPLGIGENGRICYLDPHEDAHGPHGLVAGMTGSGKSELLQTLILSLMIRYSPDKVSFFLIDYKGGGMAALFGGLPHVSGSISNLSGGNIPRAMVSIRSENERRQRLFLKAGVNRITDYERLVMKKKVDEPLPHIFIIIDEFAELRKNEPEFMRELISVAQVGRSLGVHLILATQKPQGTVDDVIASNARFRICLRVQSRQDSMDMLHKPDAAFLTGAGRAFLQVGNDEVYEEFQSAYTMAAAKGRAEISLILKDEKGERRLEKKEAPITGEHREGSLRTDLERIREEILRAAASLSLQPARKLWMKELPACITLRESVRSEAYIYPVGLYDAPRRQEQGDFIISLLAGGHHLILGRSGSGKSTLLQSLGYRMLAQEKPDTLSLYVLDHSNGLLSSLRNSRLTGGYLTEEDKERTGFLFHMLQKEMKRRKKDFAGVNFATKKQTDKKYPAIVLFIDQYGAFRQRTGERYDAVTEEILKNGETYGIYCFLTGLQLGPSDIPQRVRELCKTVLCLSMTDRMQAAQAFLTTRLDLRIEEGPPGRGMGFVDQELLAFQTGLCFPGNEIARRQFLESFIEKQNELFPGEHAETVPTIPDKPQLSDLMKACRREAEDGIPMLPVGYCLKSGELFCLPYRETGSFLITGRKKSGRKNLIRIIEAMAVYCQVPFRTVSTVSELLEIMSYKTDRKTVILLSDPAEMLAGFYEGAYSRDEEETLSALIEENKESCRYCLVFRLGREESLSFAGRRLFEALTGESYGICMGGALQEQPFFAFSELSFTAKSAAKKPGQGDVPWLSDRLFSGEVKIPLWKECTI
ncbi:MAG: FHA domain-containing protein [Lachnospiraceae bacterium]|nr:FHA domain-containing protein [Lachnospiraceae bacterium]